MLEEFMSELASRENEGYRPDKIGVVGISKHVWIMAVQLAVITLFCWATVWINLEYLYPGRNDLERWLLEGHVHVVFGLTMVSWGLWTLQVFSNGNLLGRALQNAMACALVILGYLMVFGLIIVGV